MIRKYAIRLGLKILCGVAIVATGLASHGSLFSLKSFGDSLLRENYELLKRKSPELAKKKLKKRKITYKECHRIWNKPLKNKGKIIKKLKNRCVYNPNDLKSKR